MCVGQDMADRNSTHKIGGVGLEVEINESLLGGVKYGRGNPFRHRPVQIKPITFLVLPKYLITFLKKCANLILVLFATKGC